MLNEKYTKADNYNALRTLVATDVWDDKATQDRLLTFIDHELELLNKRSVKSKDYQQKHRLSMETDEISLGINSVFGDTDAALSIPEITAKIVSATPQKVAYRLNKLYQAGIIDKEVRVVKDEGGVARKITYYKWINA